MTLDFVCIQNKIWSEITICTLLLFHQTVICFHACTRFRWWHEVSRIAINALDISCSYHCVDGASYTTDTGLSVCVGLDYKECNVFTSINPVLHYAWPAEQRVESKSGICAFVWVESVRRQDEILMFLDMKYKDQMFPQAKDGNWKTDVAFLLDVLEHVNNLIIILQGKDSLVYELHTAVHAFKTTLLCS